MEEGKKFDEGEMSGSYLGQRQTHSSGSTWSRWGGKKRGVGKGEREREREASGVCFFSLLLAAVIERVGRRGRRRESNAHSRRERKRDVGRLFCLSNPRETFRFSFFCPSVGGG